MNPVDIAKNEFLLDGAAYFSDKKELYLTVKQKISTLLPVDISEVRICGSAYWGYRFKDESPFSPGVSDLDVALISPQLFCRCMAEIRQLTKNFNDQTAFPQPTRRISVYVEFRDYAFGKGIIRTDHLPNVKTRADLERASEVISREFLSHFEKISFSIYDSALSFAVKQAGAAGKFRS